VIHAVGPRWQGGSHGERELLAGAYRSSLELAVRNGLRSVAFPSVSTGAYGYPIEDAAAVALQTVVEFLQQNAGRLDLVRFVLFTPRDAGIYEDALKQLLPN
jgi:O-acetyl-ADP-ribose deacetylase (regulator of RNase III)